MTPTARSILVVLTVWLGTGFATVGGSLIGRLVGRWGLFAGAILGAVVGTSAAVALVTRVGWLPRSNSNGAIVGGITGFIVAAAILACGPDIESPITPVVLCSMAGFGALLGGGVAQGLSDR